MLLNVVSLSWFTFTENAWLNELWNCADPSGYSPVKSKCVKDSRCGWKHSTELADWYTDNLVQVRRNGRDQRILEKTYISRTEPSWIGAVKGVDLIHITLMQVAIVSSLYYLCLHQQGTGSCGLPDWGRVTLIVIRLSGFVFVFV